MQISKIVKTLMTAKDAYYSGEPIMSDEDFDVLEDSLREEDPENSYFDVVGVASSKSKVKHAIPMLSLDKTKTVEGVISWIQKMGLNNKELVIEPKIDGLSCSILYENGSLVSITTRGDGYVGQNITHIAKFVKSIPQKLCNKSGSKEVRGELYLPKNTKFPNPDEKPLRNLAAGLINRKDTGLEDLNFVHFVAYQFLGDKSRYESEKLELLELNKFQVVSYKLVSSIEEANSYYSRYLDKLRNEWSYQTDGLVLVVNDTEMWPILEKKYIVNHHHFYNLALKPPSQSRETILENIEWNVSKLGKVIPVAIVKPISIGGASITRCSLNNLDFMEKLNLGIGDRVLIERANDVIPYFKGNLEKHAADKNLIPKECPSCKAILQREGVHLVCKWGDCPEKLVQKILHWVTKCEMDGLSESFVRRMVESERVFSIKDLYLLSAEDFEGLDGFGTKKIENALSQIASSKEISIRQFVVRLGINGVGQRAMEKLGINTLKELLTYKSNGSVVSKTLAEFIESNKRLIKDLISVVKVYSEIPKKKGIQNVCMTGTGPLPRKELISEIEKMNYTFVDHVSKDTNILVCEDTTGTSGKLAKAKLLGVKLVSYEDFFKIQ